MPIVTSDFSPSLPFKNTHLNSIYRSLFTWEKNRYKRKRIETEDQDFIDLDFSIVGSDRIAIVIHGLEGNSYSSYVMAAAFELNSAGIDAVSFNLRGCSGEDNRLLSSYHSGKTDDLDLVIKHLQTNYTFKHIAVVGYSLGGNLTLKYMGEYAEKMDDSICCAIAISVPCDLAAASLELSLKKNRLYMNRFLKSMRTKVRKKNKTFRDYNVDLKKLKKAKNFKDIDQLYTAPVFGYASPEAYWEQESSKPYLSKIRRPSLLITSSDDPFLPEACYPYEEARQSDYFYLEVTEHGGHVGFLNSFRKRKNRWLEHRIIEFIQNHLPKQ